jgi:hypothetical protein
MTYYTRHTSISAPRYYVGAGAAADAAAASGYSDHRAMCCTDQSKTTSHQYVQVDDSSNHPHH